jgi:hypothetical protein
MSRTVPNPSDRLNFFHGLKDKKSVYGRNVLSYDASSYKKKGHFLFFTL